MKNVQENDEPMLKAIKNDLDESLEHVDGPTRSRLTQIRLQAVARAGKQSIDPVWIPVAVLVGAGLVAALVLYQPRVPVQEYEMIDNLDLISTSDDLEFYENLEFYEWLVENDLQT